MHRSSRVCRNFPASEAGSGVAWRLKQRLKWSDNNLPFSVNPFQTLFASPGLGGVIAVNTNHCHQFNQMLSKNSHNKRFLQNK